MTPKALTPHGVIYPAGNETYHAIRSINEFGEFAHAAAYASQLMADGKAQFPDEALMQASAELRRIRYAKEGYAPHKKARDGLKKHADSLDTVSNRRVFPANQALKKESEE
ncbi:MULTISPECIES: hypothetical protein [Xanthomonas]|nr:hypothetical protein [Xanthomonas pisi]